MSATFGHLPAKAAGDACPDCGDRLAYCDGDPAYSGGTGSGPCVYCPDCGSQWAVDWHRQIQHDLSDPRRQVAEWVIWLLLAVVSIACVAAGWWITGLPA